MIDGEHKDLSIARQCELVSISRPAYYYQPTGETELNLNLMRLIMPEACFQHDEQFLATPFYGARQMARHLRRQGYVVSRSCRRRASRCGGYAG